MCDLSNDERLFLSIFRKFKITAGKGLSLQSINSAIHHLNINNESEAFQSLTNKNYLKINTNKVILLTEDGERYLYGVFDIDDGLKELMSIFKEFKIGKKEILLIQSFLAKKDQLISPLNIKKLDEIIEHAIENNYIEEKPRGFLLTEKGREFIDTI